MVMLGKQQAGDDIFGSSPADIDIFFM